MAAVHSRVLLAIGAWLLGASAAACGSLVAISLIGQSIADPATQQLAASSVNRALAARHGSDRSPGPTPRASATRPAATAPLTSSPGAVAPAGTLLSSPGGSVVAMCGTAGAFLISWSPQPGYAAKDVARGPAATAGLLFETGNHGVSLIVTCTGSVPSASVTTVVNGHGAGAGSGKGKGSGSAGSNAPGGGNGSGGGDGSGDG